MLLDSLLQPLPGDNLLHRLQKDLPAGLLLFVVVFGVEKADLIHGGLIIVGKRYFRSYAGVFQSLLRGVSSPLLGSTSI